MESKTVYHLEVVLRVTSIRRVTLYALVRNEKLKDSTLKCGDRSEEGLYIAC